MSTRTARSFLVAATALLMGAAVLLTFAPPGQAEQAPHARTSARSAPSSSPGSPYDPFVRDWTGHTRSLHVREDRVAREVVYSGCCEKGADVKFRVSKPSGDTKKGSLRAVVLRVKFWDADLGGPRPERGDVVTWRVRHGVLYEPLVGTNYCTPAAGRRGVCGA